MFCGCGLSPVFDDDDDDEFRFNDASTLTSHLRQNGNYINLFL